jgi:N-methylhydantoinase B
MATHKNAVGRGEGIGAPSGFGAAGGKSGAGGELTLLLDDGRTVDPPKYASNDTAAQRTVLSHRAVGGYADARMRDPSHVLRDVRDGIVSIAAAGSEYGVAIARDRRSIDQLRTRELRRA